MAVVNFTNATENGDTSSAGKSFANVPSFGCTAKGHRQNDKYDMHYTCLKYIAKNMKIKRLRSERCEPYNVVPGEFIMLC